MSEKKSATRLLKHEFTEVETKDIGFELATQTQLLQDLKNQKGAMQSSFASSMKAAEERIASLSNKVAQGFEMREVACTVEYHTPERNKKRLTRTDTNESWDEPMGDTDFNLFNQYKEDKGEDVDGDEVNVEGAQEQEEDKPKGRSRKEEA